MALGHIENAPNLCQTIVGKILSYIFNLYLIIYFSSSPDLRHIRRIFGVDLTTFVKASNSLRPFVVDLLVSEVERRGMCIEGIYRACGSSEEIDTLKNHFENTLWEQTEVYLRSVEDIHVVTGLLKLYLRLLPIPLITFDAYPMFIETVSK